VDSLSFHLVQKSPVTSTALTSTGFTDVRVERPEPSTPWNVIVAIR
jgi:hypothetical protein